MVYAPPRVDAATAAARTRLKATASAFAYVMRTLPQDVQDVICARTAALAAEAAAQRVRADRAEAALEACRAERGRR